MVGEYATYVAAIGNSDFEPPRRQDAKGRRAVHYYYQKILLGVSASWRFISSPSPLEPIGPQQTIWARLMIQ
jgi:hypothetical protein